MLFRDGKLDMTAKEIIPLEKIGLDHKLHGKISASLKNYLKEIVRNMNYLKEIVRNIMLM